MHEEANNLKSLKLGVVTVSDRVSKGIYEDLSGPAILEWLDQRLKNKIQKFYIKIPDQQSKIKNSLLELCDKKACDLIFTTGGTGPAPKDVTPEATLQVATKVLDGFGEKMRNIGLKYVPTAILSRQLGVIRNQTLIINLPGRPSSIKQILDEIFDVVPYCLDLIGGPYLEYKKEFKTPYRPTS